MTLYFLHYERTFDGADVVVAAENVEQKLLVVAHVGRLYAQQIVEGTGDVVAFGHFGYFVYELSEGYGGVRVEAAQLHAAEDGEALVEKVGVEDGGILLYEAKTLETLHAFVRRCSRKVYLGGEFLVRKACVLLQGAQYVGVFLVETVGHGFLSAVK